MTTEKELYKQIMSYTPFKMEGIESYNEYLNRHKKEKIKLIQQAKSEWEIEFFHKIWTWMVDKKGYDGKLFQELDKKICAERIQDIKQ